MKHIQRLVAVLAAMLALLQSAYGQAATFKGNFGFPAGSATVANPWNIDVFEPPAVAGGAPKKTSISITNLPAYNPAVETPAQASVRKATAVCNALNAAGALGAGRCTVGATVMVPRIVGRNRITGQNIIVNYPSTPVTITGLLRGTPPQALTNPVRELGDGGAFVPGGGGGSGTMPYSPKMTPPSSGRSPGSYSATSLADPVLFDSSSPDDQLNQRSMVEFGILEVFVARYFPNIGDTLTDVLMGLNSELNAGGLSASFDPANTMLTINRQIVDGETLVWGNTDTGLDFSVGAIPEPGSAALALVATALFARRRRRQ